MQFALYPPTALPSARTQRGVMAQIRHHREDLVMHDLFPKKVTDAVLYTLSDLEKLSMPLLEDEETEAVCVIDAFFDAE